MAQALTLTGIDSHLEHSTLTTRKASDAIFQGPETSALKTINIGELLDQQRDTRPDKTAIISKWQGNRRVTYRQLHKECQDVAQSLLRLGVRPSDRVVVLAGNSLEYAQLFYAVSGIGAVFSIINPTVTTEEIVPAIEFLDSKAIFIADRIGYRKYGPLIRDIVDARRHASKLVQLGPTGRVCKGLLTWPEFLAGDDDTPADALLNKYWAKPHVDDTVCIQFTSGTTGPRKAAMLSHGNFINNAWLVGQRLAFTPDDTILCCSPVFHCFGLVCGVIAAAVYGGTAVLPSDVFVAESSLKALSEDGCTVVHAVPTMFQAMLDHPDADRHVPKMKLRTGIVAGSSLSRALLQRLSTDFNFNCMAYGYGMTELSCIVFLTTPTEVSLLDNHTSVGTVMPHTAARVVDENLVTVPPGEPGELLVSGYLTFHGYYKNPKSTASTFVRDSRGKLWLRTGDLVTIDADGRCVIFGRTKDMIKRGGENIFPGDIEKVLDLHPEITASAVVGVPDTYWGEAVVAFIQPAAAGTSTPTKDMKLWLRNKLAPHKVPEHFFWLSTGGGVPDALPVNATGKVVKKELREVAINLAETRKN